MESRFAAAALAALLASCAQPRLTEFERTLSAQDSATAALTQWCAARRIAEPAEIVAIPAHGADAPMPPDVRALLATAPGEPMGYRHVRLSCGGTVLSEAHNWFVRGRLTAAMNQALDGTDMPFGRVAAPLHFTREPVESRRGAAAGCAPGTILSHRALLRLPDGKPLAYLIECYTSANLGRGR